MNNSFDYLISKFLINYSEKDEEIQLELQYDKEDISREFRKILDKIAVEIVYDSFENEDMIQAVLSLNRIERIISVFSLILGMSNSEIAFLLNSNMNSLYVQKSKAIKKFKKYIIDHNVLY
jgi:hypothetical protein